MKIKSALSSALTLTLWVPVIFFSWLLSHNAILYFTHGGEYGILPEKIIARQDLLWNICFYFHLPSGILCLFAPLIIFIGRIFSLSRSLHIIIGKMYVWITLFIILPTGMYLALYAKGGLSTQIGFMVQAILLGVFTLQGYKAILKGNRISHMENMIRSYAMTAVVLSFRIFHILFFLYKVPYLDNYAMSQWLGIAGNALLAEIIILAITVKIKKSYKLKTI